MSDLVELQREEDVRPSRAPARHWRNIWLAMLELDLRCHLCGTAQHVADGGRFRTHCLTYPSRELAEQAAVEALAKSPQTPIRYVGPEEAP